MSTRLKAERLRELLQAKDFNKRRLDAYHACHGKWDIRQIVPQQYAALIHDDLFLQLVLADLTGFGPIQLFLDFDDWISITGTLRVVIDLDEAKETELDIGFINLGTAFSVADKIGSELQTRIDQKFPVIRTQWRRYFLQIAIPPVAAEPWLRIENRLKLVELNPYFKL